MPDRPRRWWSVGLAFALALTISDRGSGQNPEQGLIVLTELSLDSMQSARAITLFRPGDSMRATAIHGLHQSLRRFADVNLGIQVITRVAVLNRADWGWLTPLPYGFPHNFGPPANLIMTGAESQPLIGVDTLLSAGARDLTFLGHEAGHIFTWSLMPQSMLDSLRAPDLVLSPQLRARFARFDAIPEWYWEFTATYLGLAFLRAAHPTEADVFVTYCGALRDLRTPRYRSLDAWFGSMMSADVRDRGGYVQTPEGSRNFAWYQGVVCLMAEDVFNARGLAFLSRIRQLVAGEEQVATADLVTELEVASPGLVAKLEGLNVIWRPGPDII